MRYLRRGLSFLASRILGVVLVVSLFIVSFYTALNTANIWVLVDDGLEVRARAVIQNVEEARLRNFFTDEFIAQDGVLQAGLNGVSPYRDYNIRSFTHKTEFKSLWAWPWERYARAEVIESIPNIDGAILTEKREAALASGGEARLKPPAWNTGRYRVLLTRYNGRWKISGMQQLAE